MDESTVALDKFWKMDNFVRWWFFTTDATTATIVSLPLVWWTLHYHICITIIHMIIVVVVCVLFWDDQLGNVFIMSQHLIDEWYIGSFLHFKTQVLGTDRRNCISQAIVQCFDALVVCGMWDDAIEVRAGRFDGWENFLTQLFLMSRCWWGWGWWRWLWWIGWWWRRFDDGEHLPCVETHLNEIGHELLNHTEVVLCLRMKFLNVSRGGLTRTWWRWWGRGWRCTGGGGARRVGWRCWWWHFLRFLLSLCFRADDREWFFVAFFNGGMMFEFSPTKWNKNADITQQKTRKHTTHLSVNTPWTKMDLSSRASIGFNIRRHIKSHQVYNEPSDLSCEGEMEKLTQCLTSTNYKEGAQVNPSCVPLMDAMKESCGLRR